MYNSFIQWIGSKSCSVAGHVTQTLDAGPACYASQSWSMGMLILALAGLSLTVIVINARRRQRRDYF